MTKYFEVLKRDGPARLGKLLLEKENYTPCLISPKDYISIGSVFGFTSIDEAIKTAESLKGQRKLAIKPHVPQTINFRSSIVLPEIEINGPKGVVLNLSSEAEREKADVYIISAASIRTSRDLVNAVINVRNKVPADAALYAPALATPANLAFLIYLGIDLIDTIRVEVDAYFGRYHTRDGVFDFNNFRDLVCSCEFCADLAEDRDSNRKTDLLIGHNILKLSEEISIARHLIRSETMREFVERQVRVTPGLTAALRILDYEYSYLEARTPQYRKSVFYANTAESLKRVEVRRFADRVLNRYRPPRSDVLLLLPCSAKKPYSTSRSHKLFAEAIQPWKRFLHELILTSPLALVPRELETIYPASSYDVPVTGHWDLEERTWLLSCLDAYLERNRYPKIVAHIEGELREIIENHGIDADFTGGGTSSEAIIRLSKSISEVCRGATRLENLNLQRFRAVLDYYFGSHASDSLMAGDVKIRGKEVQDATGRTLAIMTPNGTIALSLEGGRRLEKCGNYIVTIGDFVPKGSLLAPGVMKADGQIRPGDEIIIRGETAFGVGRAKMSGWEMVGSNKGIAAEIRQIEAL
ncbi:MAG: archaeosine synthase subunit alpha [Methanotrichaceae archaeon]|nr:archaeosine synthase subunit alpha [Methanotrichaceae archaeon]